MFCGSHSTVFGKLFVSGYGEVCQPEAYRPTPGGGYVYIFRGFRELSDRLVELLAIFK